MTETAPEALWKRHLAYLFGAFRTAAAVARVLGVSDAAVYAWRARDQDPDLDSRAALATAYATLTDARQEASAAVLMCLQALEAVIEAPDLHDARAQAARCRSEVARTLRAISAADALHTRALPPSQRRP